MDLPDSWLGLRFRRSFAGQNFVRLARMSTRVSTIFQVHHLLWQLGKEWFDCEMTKPIAERRVTLQWRAERSQQFRKYRDPRNPDGNVRAPTTGGMRALQVLADDIYQLAHIADLPAKLVRPASRPRAVSESSLRDFDRQPLCSLCFRN